MNSATPKPEKFEFVVDESQAGIRLDTFITERVAGLSRSAVTQAIRAGCATVGGETCKPASKLSPGQIVVFTLPPPVAAGPTPENIPLDILHEDEAIVAINKPAGMVVHPAKGHWSGTLAAALGYHFEQLSAVGGPTRPGIVHRLDRDTSGVILVAKTDTAHRHLAAQFEARTVTKEYVAVVRNPPERDREVIEQPIGAHPYQREKMAIRAGHATSRPAKTLYEVSKRFASAAVLRAFPKTGRTHQIRVHLAHVGHPILCDRLYAGHARLTVRDIRALKGVLVGSKPTTADEHRVVIERQALHALRIEFAHPKTYERTAIEARLPNDMRELEQLLGSQSTP